MHVCGDGCWEDCKSPSEIGGSALCGINLRLAAAAPLLAAGMCAAKSQA